MLPGNHVNTKFLMTIKTENPSRIVLRDNKLIAFLYAGAAIGVGLLICVTMMNHVVAIMVGLAFIGVGGFILFKTRRVAIEMDRGVGKIHILLHGLGSKKEWKLGIAEIQKLLLRKLVQTQTTVSSALASARFKGDRNTTSSTTTYHRFILIFVTDRNEEIPIDFGRVKAGLMNAFTSPEDKIRRDAREVANFLNVPLDAATPSASAVFGAVRAGLAGQLQKVH